MLRDRITSFDSIAVTFNVSFASPLIFSQIDLISRISDSELAVAHFQRHYSVRLFTIILYYYNYQNSNQRNKCITPVDY